MPGKISPTLRVLMDIREELKQIRQEEKKTNARLESVEHRLESVEGRVGAVEEGVGTLARRQTEMEARLATELVAVAQSVRDVTKAVSGLGDFLRDRLDDRERVDDHERRIADLERRVQ